MPPPQNSSFLDRVVRQSVVIEYKVADQTQRPRHMVESPPEFAGEFDMMDRVNDTRTFVACEREPHRSGERADTININAVIAQHREDRNAQ